MKTSLDPTLILLKNFEESKLDAFQPKYGLFSFAGTLAIQPHTYTQAKPLKKDKDGNVLISPRNICVSPVKSGKSPDAFFSIPSYTSVGDVFKDKPQNPEKIRAAKMRKIHDTPFKDPGPFQLASQYEHLSELNTKKRSKSTIPRNFYTSPMKQGNPNCTPGVSFSSFEYQSSPTARKLIKKNQLENSEKFKPSSNSPELFDKNIYQFDRKNKPAPAKKKKKHIEVPFKPSNPGKKNLPDALFSICEYLKPSSECPTVRKRNSETPMPWKATTREFSRPTVPIEATNLNIRKMMKFY